MKYFKSLVFKCLLLQKYVLKPICDDFLGQSKSALGIHYEVF